ncbi:acetyl/propionyl/methylcrotonyl-CoA carboxylase subunit alpha [Microbacterium aureliae]
MTDLLFHTVLVANRGEIARRVIRTLRRLGIRSIAVYSDADAGEPHVRDADAAVRIGPAAAVSSYLDVDAVVAAAVASGAQAVHPGYGFLSESPALARACRAAGLAFVGPPEAALEVMGDKIRAKEHVASHGVPTVPGFSAAGMTDAEIAAAADAAGYPLLVKPSAGGGGKGMQVVRSANELGDALATARRVARASFGDDTLLLERLIERPRHIEVQVLADAHDTVVHLGERECTLQRRHQKVIEEAPSPVVSAATRDRLGKAACAAARSVDYRGAGTVEFLVSGAAPDDFFFIEMNTRLQVEHPVTEMVTGVDLVEEQLRAAAGLALSERACAIDRGETPLHGHALEARVYAETPARGFLPATGDVLAWRAPAGDGIRVEAGVATGSRVGADYDPMIAKIIAWGPDRPTALERLDAALAGTVVLGVDTNIAFLRRLLADEGVRDGDMDTGLIDRMPEPGHPEPSPAALAGAAAADPPAPARPGAWGDVAPGWRAGLPARAAQRWFADDAGAVRMAEVPAEPPAADVARDADGAVWVHVDGAAHRLQPLSRRQVFELKRRGAAASAGAVDPDLRAPMPGAVVAVHVADGDRVRAGDRVVTIEAMKMEHPVTAPADGVVRVRVVPGEQVRRDQTLAHLTLDAPATEPGAAASAS